MYHVPVHPLKQVHPIVGKKEKDKSDFKLLSFSKK